MVKITNNLRFSQLYKALKISFLLLFISNKSLQGNKS